ncbi:hypothetical protein BaRGS_00004770 [Batillaria attramentaria]|uniref:Uncharacterized protein n=1 Tax=Batillaria attramentaria TaxID=370345 RepID=A0ABD0LX96_9CAEN
MRQPKKVQKKDTHTNCFCSSPAEAFLWVKDNVGKVATEGWEGPLDRGWGSGWVERSGIALIVLFSKQAEESRESKTYPCFRIAVRPSWTAGKSLD